MGSPASSGNDWGVPPTFSQYRPPVGPSVNYGPARSTQQDLPIAGYAHHAVKKWQKVN